MNKSKRSILSIALIAIASTLSFSASAIDYGWSNSHTTGYTHGNSWSNSDIFSYQSGDKEITLPNSYSVEAYENYDYKNVQQAGYTNGYFSAGSNANIAGNTVTGSRWEQSKEWGANSTNVIGETYSYSDVFEYSVSGDGTVTDTNNTYTEGYTTYGSNNNSSFVTRRNSFLRFSE